MALIALLLVGCEGIGTSETRHATPVALDTGYVTYEHPSRVFTLRTPPEWTGRELPDENGVRVEFSSLKDAEVVTWLSVVVVNTGQPMTPEAFAQAVEAYLPPEDLAAYDWREFDRAAQSDLSYRITGIRTYPRLGPRSLNVFLQRDGVFFSALELDISDADAAMLETLRRVVNTFRVNTNAELAVGTVQQAAAGVTSYSGVIGFNGYHAWTDGRGVFHITGEVINPTPYPLEAVLVTGILFDSQDQRLGEQQDILNVDVLRSCGSTPCRPGEGVPFDLRFEGGRPPGTVRYELHVAAREADFMLQTFYGPENFSIVKDPAVITEQGDLLVRGELANIGPRTATAVRVVVTVWDDQGHVVATETVFIPQQEVAPQDSVAFEVPVEEWGGAPVEYTWMVVGSIGETG